MGRSRVGAGLSLGAVSFAILLAQPAHPQQAGPKVGYVFEPADRTPVVLARFPFFFEGHLDSYGAFVPNPKAPAIECKVAQEHRSEWIAALEKRTAPIYNMVRSWLSGDSVYEYVLGDGLILGQLNGEHFVPSIEDNLTIKVIRMEEYLRTYHPERHIRIYNLPGRIVPRPKDAKK